MTTIQSFSIRCNGSCGRKHESHTVRIIGERVTCDCPRWAFRHLECRHIREVKAIITERLQSDLRAVLTQAVERKRGTALGEFELSILSDLLNSIFEPETRNESRKLSAAG